MFGKAHYKCKMQEKVYCPQAHNNRAKTDQIPFQSPSLYLSTGNQAGELCCKRCTPFMFTVFFNNIFVRSSHGQSKCCTIRRKGGKVKIKSKKKRTTLLANWDQGSSTFFFFATANSTAICIPVNISVYLCWVYTLEKSGCVSKQAYARPKRQNSFPKWFYRLAHPAATPH